MTEPSPASTNVRNPWRTGRTVGRTIYEQVGSRPSKDDRLIGVMDSPELAQAAVNAVNGVTPKPVGNVLDRTDVREITFRVIAARAHEDKAFKALMDPLGAFTFFDILDGICDAVVEAVARGGVEPEREGSE